MAGDPGRDVVYKRSNAWRPIDQLQSTEKPVMGWSRASNILPVTRAYWRVVSAYSATIRMRARVASFKNVPEFSDRCLTKMFLSRS